MDIEQLKVGDRVQMHPATDAWMRGMRYGEVVAIGNARVRVKLDKGFSAKGAWRSPSNILEVVS